LSSLASLYHRYREAGVYETKDGDTTKWRIENLPRQGLADEMETSLTPAVKVK
jgi:hypothetical protein